MCFRCNFWSRRVSDQAPYLSQIYDRSAWTSQVCRIMAQHLYREPKNHPFTYFEGPVKALPHLPAVPLQPFSCPCSFKVRRSRRSCQFLGCCYGAQSKFPNSNPLMFLRAFLEHQVPYGRRSSALQPVDIPQRRRFRGSSWLSAPVGLGASCSVLCKGSYRVWSIAASSKDLPQHGRLRS